MRAGVAGEYLHLNRANWDERAPAHVASADYSVARFLAEPDFLSGVVRFDRPRLGDIAGLDGVHLQCHIGTDTLSLARLGAQMTGLDFSPASLVQARALAEASGATIPFVEADVYRAADVLGAERFDLVYTGIGAIMWLPSIERWAHTAAALLKPGGRLFIRDAHPVLMAVDEKRPDALTLRYPYFERPEPLVWEDDGTYVDTDVRIQSTVTHEWNHGLGEMITALLAHGMTLTGLEEHVSVPWEALPGRMERDDDGEWRMLEDPWRLPLSFTLQATKNA
ncbi:bifunctional 2-polyprenyl-6-hydroxyphenol methylase/3-demethylubiquinol 3-O-methyltransferase UbiG [Homoserinimonas sp. OAct 916]|uniref:class I SAM-dependent methyltransferase n=1 Tax=Homoserinimonas sp. OAct 916 TaxID=2211450 RepID=UPI000DBE3304|nr:class I SAM-dependent methyltransferase [Homoserinimonas sp. OAct 916]